MRSFIYLTLLFSLHCQAQSAEEIDQPDIIQFIDREHKVSYLVTKPGQAAHPAIVMRQILEKDGQLVIKMTAQGGGNKEALKAWLDYMSLQD